MPSASPALGAGDVEVRTEGGRVTHKRLGFTLVKPVLFLPFGPHGGLGRLDTAGLS